MSRKIPEKEYKKTRSFRFKQWLDGTKDPYLDVVEMKPQKEFCENNEIIKKREEEDREIFQRVDRKSVV